MVSWIRSLCCEGCLIQPQKWGKIPHLLILLSYTPNVLIGVMRRTYSRTYRRYEYVLITWFVKNKTKIKTLFYMTDDFRVGELYEIHRLCQEGAKLLCFFLLVQVFYGSWLMRIIDQLLNNLSQLFNNLYELKIYANDCNQS